MTMGRDREASQIHQPLVEAEATEEMMAKNQNDNAAGAMAYRNLYDKHGLQLP